MGGPISTLVQVVRDDGTLLDWDDVGGEGGGGGGSTQYDEDSQHANGEKLTMAGVVRRDSASSGVNGNNDRAVLSIDANGKLWVHDEDIVSAVGTASAAIVSAIEGIEVSFDGQITASTEYDDGQDLEESPATGGMVMWHDKGADVARVVSEEDPLPVAASIDPSGLATEAKQDTLIGHVDGIESALATMDGVLDSILAAFSGLATDAKLDSIIADTADIETATELLASAVAEFGENATPDHGLMLAWEHTTSGNLLPVGEFNPLPVMDATLPLVAQLSGEDAPTDPYGLSLVYKSAITGDWESPREDQGFPTADGQLYTLIYQTLNNAETRMQVNPIVGQDGITAGAGAVAANTPRVTHASDDPVTTALQVIDDWDESDRAKVNIISGQAGVAAGAGAVGATVQRVTLASDDPAVAALQILDNIVDGNEAQVDVVTLPATPAGSNLIGQIIHQSGDRIFQGTTELTLKRAVIDVASSGNNTIISAVASKKFRVFAVMLVAAGAVNVRFETGADGTALSGQMNLVANTGFVLPFNSYGWFETGTANTLLNLELSGAVSVDGVLLYAEID